MGEIEESMRQKMAEEHRAQKEAEKAAAKIQKLTDLANARQVEIDDLKAKLELADQIHAEQLRRTGQAVERSKGLEEELEELRGEKVAQEEEIKELHDEAALVRLVARAALFRRFAEGKITPEMAKEELASFRDLMGSEDLLDADDLKDAEEEIREAEQQQPEAKISGEEVAIDAASGSGLEAEVAIEQLPPVVEGSDIPPP
jgi:type I site-specific restriction-modification system R (restriction) subunit